MFTNMLKYAKLDDSLVVLGYRQRSRKGTEIGGVTMKRKRIHWSTVIFIAVLLLFVGFIASIIMAFYGNPITAVIATAKIRNYVEDTYPNMDLEVPKAGYNFKFEEYISHVESKTSPDTHFDVSWVKGKIYDTYESFVTRRGNTFDRLSREFRDRVEQIIQKEFLYTTSILLVDLGKEEQNISHLTLDMPLDPSNPPMPANLTIYILSNDVSYEFLSARLQELQSIMEENKIPIATYSVVVEEPLIEGEEKAAPDGENIYLYDFPSEKISSDNLVEVIKEHQKTWEANNSKGPEKDKR